VEITGLRSLALLLLLLLVDLRCLELVGRTWAFAARAAVFVVVALVARATIEGVATLPAGRRALLALPGLRGSPARATVTVATEVAARRATVAKLAAWRSVAEVTTRATVAAEVAAKVTAWATVVVLAARRSVTEVTTRRSVAKVTTRATVVVLAARRSVAEVAILTARRAVVEVATRAAIIILATRAAIIILATWRTVIEAAAWRTIIELAILAARWTLIVLAARAILIVTAWWPVAIVAVLAARGAITKVAARAAIIKAAARPALAEVAARRAIPSLGALAVRRGFALRALIRRVDMNGAPIHHRAVERLHGSTHRLLIGQLDKAKSLALVGIAVAYHAGLDDLTKHFEQIRKLLIRCGIGEIPHVHPVRHTGSLTILSAVTAPGPCRKAGAHTRPLGRTSTHTSIARQYAASLTGSAQPLRQTGRAAQTSIGVQRHRQDHSQGAPSSIHQRRLTSL
jgi:hypothetical protein